MGEELEAKDRSLKASCEHDFNQYNCSCCTAVEWCRRCGALRLEETIPGSLNSRKVIVLAGEKPE